MFAVGEHIRLQGQERAAGVHQVHTREVVFERDFLRAQVLLDRDGIIRATLYRRVVGNDHALLAFDTADAGDDAPGGNVIVVERMPPQLSDLEERRSAVQETVHAIPGQQLSPADVASS